MIRSVEEGNAAAMLLGKTWRYDPHDHTFNDLGKVYDADTMEYLGVLMPGEGGYSFEEIRVRCRRVHMGEIGINAEE